jgi:hypothetical protein
LIDVSYDSDRAASLLLPDGSLLPVVRLLRFTRHELSGMIGAQVSAFLDAPEDTPIEAFGFVAA